MSAVQYPCLFDEHLEHRGVDRSTPRVQTVSSYSYRGLFSILLNLLVTIASVADVQFAAKVLHDN